jgi:hypothetical protein
MSFNSTMREESFERRTIRAAPARRHVGKNKEGYAK